MLVDHSIGAEAATNIAGSVRGTVERRIVLITPGERHRLPALKESGFTGYLVKPVRAASLKAQLASAEAFDGSAVAPPDASAAPAAPAGIAGAGRALAVLVAEDNEINALLTSALLTRLGHRPTVVANGTEALEAWQAARDGGAAYDVVSL